MEALGLAHLARRAGAAAVVRPAQARDAGAGRRIGRAACGCSTSRSMRSTRTAPSGSRRLIDRPSRVGRRGARRVAPAAARRLAAAGACSRDRRADRCATCGAASPARRGCRSPSSCWSRRWCRSRSGRTRGCWRGSAPGVLWIAALDRRAAADRAADRARPRRRRARPARCSTASPRRASPAPRSPRTG